MTKSKPFTYTAAVSTPEISLESIQKTMAELNKHRFAMFEGLPVMKDPTGLFCPTDGFVVVMGEKMFNEFKDRK